MEPPAANDSIIAPPHETSPTAPSNLSRASAAEPSSAPDEAIAGSRRPDPTATTSPPEKRMPQATPIAAQLSAKNAGTSAPSSSTATTTPRQTARKSTGGRIGSLTQAIELLKQAAREADDPQGIDLAIRILWCHSTNTRLARRLKELDKELDKANGQLDRTTSTVRWVVARLEALQSSLTPVALEGISDVLSQLNQI